MKDKTKLLRIEFEAERQKAAPKRTRGPSRNKLTVEQKAIIRALPDDALDIPVVVEARCTICQLLNEDRDLYRYVNRSLLDGSGYDDIMAHCEAAGHPVRRQTLSRHRNNHLMIFVMNAITMHLELSVIAQKLGDVQDGNIGVLMSRLLCVLLLPAINRLTPEKLAKLPPAQLINLGLSAAKAAGQVQANDAMARLRAADLQLRLLDLSEGDRAAINRAIESMRVEFAKRPDLWKVVEPALQQLTAGGGEA